jgi:hypothetical protein
MNVRERLTSARVPVRFTGGAALVRTPAGSDGFQMAAMTQR